jgi:hypothetical protein
MLGIAGDVQEAPGHSAKEQAVELARIAEDKRTEVLGQGKNRVLVGRVQNFALSVGEPRGSGHALAFRAVPVAAGIISTSLMSAVITAGLVAAKGRCVAQLDGPQRPVLLAAQPVAIAL